MDPIAMLIFIRIASGSPPGLSADGPNRLVQKRIHIEW
jgi:hypothetical protein